MSDEVRGNRSSMAREDLLLEATVKYWWQRKWFIAQILLVFIIVFAGLLFLIPKSYRAQASIIVMPPRFMPEIRTQPLTVSTAKSLLETHELYQQIINRLRRYRHVVENLAGTGTVTAETVDKISNMTVSELLADGRMTEEDATAIAKLERTEIRGLLEFEREDLADMNVDGLSEMLSSEEMVEKKTAADIIYSPVLQLYAVSDSGNKAQIIVNLWAKLFEDKYSMLTRGQTQKLYESLENQQEAGQEELENIQKVLVEFKLQNNLELIQRQITDYTESFSEYHKLLVKNKTELVTLEATLQSLNTLVAALEGPGEVWVGSLMVDVETSNPQVTDYMTLSNKELGPEISPIIRRRRDEAMRSRQDLVTVLEQASTFYQNNPMELLIAERDRFATETLREKTELRQNFVQSEVLGSSLAELNATIETTSDTVSLLTALPDEIIGEMLTSDRASDIEEATSMHLNRQQINPLWETLVKQRAEVSKNLREAEATINELSVDLPKKEKELRELSERIFQGKQAKQLVDTRVERYTDLNDDLYESYAKMKEEVFTTGWQITLLKEEIDSLTIAIEEARKEIEQLRGSYEAAAAEMEILELRKKAVVERAELLTQKLQESMVAIREEVSDISMASKAIAPSRHFFPPRTLLLAAMTLLSAGLLLGIMSRRRYRELVAA